MHGNVWEWCSDFYDEYPENAQNNPKGSSMGNTHVFRGGGWFCNAYCSRSAFRFYNFPNYGKPILGLRLVSLK